MNSTSTNLCFSLWLCCITEKTAWPAASEWTIVNQLLRRGAEGHGNPLGSVRAGGKKQRFSGGQLPPWEAGRRGSSFSPGSAAPKFQLRLAEPRVDVELPSHKGNMSGLYQILLPFHSLLPSAPSHSLFPRIEFAAAHIIFSREIVLIWTNKYLICHCCLLLKVLTTFCSFHFSDVTFLWSQTPPLWEEVQNLLMFTFVTNTIRTYLFMFIYMIRAKWLKLSYWPNNVSYFLADDVLHPVWEITSCAFSGAPTRECEGHWCLTVSVTGTYLKMEFNLILKNAAERSRWYRNTISSTLTILPSTLLLLGNEFAAFPCFLLVLFD